MRTSVRVDRDAQGRLRTVVHAGHLAPRVLDRGPDHVRIALVATVALLLAGDDVDVRVEVAADVTVEIVETAATVAYDMRGGRASWHAGVHVAAGGRLVWDALPFVLSDGADVDRSLDVQLADGATALWRETVLLGRSGQRGGAARLRTRARRTDGTPLLYEDLDLDGHRAPDPVLLGSARVLDTVTLLGARLPHTGPDVLQLAEPGTVLRYLGGELHESPLGSVVGQTSFDNCNKTDVGGPVTETVR